MAFGNERTQILSTEKMIDYAKRSPKQRFLIATETGIIHRLEQEAPGKRFEAVRDDAECRYMKLTTLEKVRDSLRDGKHRITVEPELAERARLAIERMVAITLAVTASTYGLPSAAGATVRPITPATAISVSTYGRIVEERRRLTASTPGASARARSRSRTGARPRTRPPAASCRRSSRRAR